MKMFYFPNSVTSVTSVVNLFSVFLIGWFLSRRFSTGCYEWINKVLLILEHYLTSFL